MTDYMFKKTIFPVGQGGFSMGVVTELSSSDVPFSYVYDCGSDQLKSLKREMDKAKSYLKLDCEKLDVVYLSHLDSDHINGFDCLCEMVDRKIGKVVLPYLDIKESCYHIACELAKNTTSGLYLEYLSNPVEWVKKRVPEAQIVLLQPSDDDDIIDPPRISNDTIWQNSMLMGRSLSTEHAGLASHQWMAQQSASASGKTLVSLLSWIPPRSRKKIDNFAKELLAEGFGRLTRKRLTNILKDPDERKKLRACFLKLSSDHNVISINLLVKNISPAQFMIRDENIYHHRHYRDDLDWFNEEITSLGVIMTGDSNLLPQSYYSKWIGFFKVNAGDFNIISLPHHGSSLNFNSRLLEDFKKAHYIAQSDGKSYGHPSQEVIEKISSYSKHSYSCVDECPKNLFQAEYIFSI